jgi:hypothetical protein
MVGTLQDILIPVEGASKMSDVGLDGLSGRLRRSVTPQFIDQPVGRHRLSGADREDREQSPPLATSETHRPPIGCDLDWPQEPQLHPFEITPPHSTMPAPFAVRLPAIRLTSRIRR